MQTGVHGKIEDLKKVKDGEDVAAIQSAQTALSSEIQKIGQAAYQQPENKENPPKEEGPAQEGEKKE